MHTITDPNSVVLAGDVMDWATLKVGEVRTLVLTGAGVMGIIAVLTAWWKTRSWVGTLVAFVLAALVLWGISNLAVLKTKVGSEIDETGNQAVKFIPAEELPGAGESGRLL